MEAPRQKLMNESATVVATTTLAVVEEGLVTSDDIDSRRTALFYAVRVDAIEGAGQVAAGSGVAHAFSLCVALSAREVSQRSFALSRTASAEARDGSVVGTSGHLHARTLRPGR